MLAFLGLIGTLIQIWIVALVDIHEYRRGYYIALDRQKQVGDRTPSLLRKIC